jgi:hypothetical protein
MESDKMNIMCLHLKGFLGTVADKAKEASLFLLDIRVEKTKSKAKRRK